MRGKCPSADFFWSACSRIRAECRDLQSKSPYSVRTRENTDKENPQYRHFLRSVIYCTLLVLDVKYSTKFFGTLFMKIPEDICFREVRLVFIYKKGLSFHFLQSPDSF